MTYEERIKAAFNTAWPDLTLAHRVFEAQEHYVRDILREIAYPDPDIPLDRAWVENAVKVTGSVASFLCLPAHEGILIKNLLPNYKRFTPRELELAEEAEGTAGMLGRQLRVHRDQFSYLLKCEAR